MFTQIKSICEWLFLFIYFLPSLSPKDPSKCAKGTMPDVGMWSHIPDISHTSEGLRVKEIAASSRNRWSNPTESTWVQAYNPCQPPLSEHCIHTCDYTASRNSSQGDKINGQNMKRDSLPKGMMRSTTSVDFCASKVSHYWCTQPKSGVIRVFKYFLVLHIQWSSHM